MADGGNLSSHTSIPYHGVTSTSSSEQPHIAPVFHFHTIAGATSTSPSIQTREHRASADGFWWDRRKEPHLNIQRQSPVWFNLTNGENWYIQVLGRWWLWRIFIVWFIRLSVLVHWWRHWWHHNWINIKIQRLSLKAKSDLYKDAFYLQPILCDPRSETFTRKGQN